MIKIHGPQGIRVWQGYRAANYKNNRENFIKTLEDLLFPITVQMMEPIGLRSYFPALLPESSFTLPDEVALIAFASQEEHQRVKHSTTAGKAHNALQSSIYNTSNSTDIPVSKSDFPIAFEHKLEFGQPYYLCNKEINWRDNKTSLYCAKRLPHISPTKMIQHIQSVIPAWVNQNTNINGSILVCEKDFVLYWEHSTFWDSEPSFSSLFPFFAPVLERPVISGKPKIKKIPALNATVSNYLTINSGEIFDIRLMETTIHKSLPTVRLNLEGQAS